MTKTFLNPDSILDYSIDSSKLKEETFKTINGESLFGEGDINLYINNDNSPFIGGVGINSALLNGENGCIADGQNSLAAGYGARALGETSIALGRFCEASGKGSVALSGLMMSVKFTGEANSTSYTITSFNGGSGEFLVGASIYNTSDLLNPIATITAVEVIHEKDMIITTDKTLSTSSISNKSFGLLKNRAVGLSSFAVCGTAVGNNSVAIGKNTNSIGESSMSLGFENFSVGNLSTAIGYQNTTKGGYSTAIGSDNISSGEYSLSLGRSSQAVGKGSIHIGNSVGVKINISSVSGRDKIVAASNSIDIPELKGYTIIKGNISHNIEDVTYDEVEGRYHLILDNDLDSSITELPITGNTTGAGSFSIGPNISTGNFSISIGFSNIVKGEQSLALGHGLKTFSSDEFAAGNYNISHVGDSDSSTTLLSLGCGVNNHNRSNAIEVMKNGDIWLGGYELGQKIYDGDLNQSLIYTKQEVDAAIAEAIAQALNNNQ